MNAIKKTGWLSTVCKTFIFGASILASTTIVEARSPNQASPLGINTNEAVENDTSLPFVDLFRLSLPFEEARPWLTKGNVRYDSNGWPMQLNGGKAGTRFLNQIDPEALPQGLYTVKYDGEGVLRYGASAKLIRRSQGVDLIQLTPMNDKRITASLIIDSSNPKNYVRNIRILMPGGICANNPFQRVTAATNCRGNFQSFADHHQRIVFNPDYLNFMKDFKVLRFMNMAGITRNNLTHWARRPHMKEATWGGREGFRGVPLEIMVKLANQLNADPWFSLPHAADNDFIKRYALYVRQNLSRHLKIYVEYSNETWNGIFVPQAEHMKQNGMRYKLDRDRNVAGAKYYSMRSVRIFKMWEQTFGGKQRLVRVLSGLTSNTNLSKTSLSYRKAYKDVDALAIAPYFYVGQDAMPRIRSVAHVFKELTSPRNKYSVEKVIERIQEQAGIAKNYGVDLIAYEGGQHFVHRRTHSNTQGATPHLIQANRQPQMAQMYRRLLDGWKNAGGKLFVAFSAPRAYTWHGSWGLKEHIRQADNRAPKYQALMAFSRSRPCWWAGCNSRHIQRSPKPVQISSGPDHYLPEALPNKRSVTIRKLNNSSGNHYAADNQMKSVINGVVQGHRDLAGSWQSTWDDENLYVQVRITDDRQINDSKHAWADDSIEIYIDADGSRKDRYDGWNDFQLTYRLHDQTLSIGLNTPHDKIDAVQHKMVKSPQGYQLDTVIPWHTLNVRPRSGLRVGFDIQVNDDDNGHQRDAKLAWNATSDKAWKDPRMFGELILAN